MLIAVSVFFASIPANAENLCPVPSLLFSDGFESGDLSAWDGSSTETGDTLAASTEQAKTGTYSAKAVIDTVTDAQAMVWKNITGQTTLYVRTYILFSHLHCNIDPVPVSSIHSIGNCANSVIGNIKLGAERNEVGSTSFKS